MKEEELKRKYERGHMNNNESLGIKTPVPKVDQTPEFVTPVTVPLIGTT